MAMYDSDKDYMLARKMDQFSVTVKVVTGYCWFFGLANHNKVIV